jgi:hypothetical protein
MGQREKTKREREKKILETHQSSNHDTTSTIENISIRQVQRPQEKSSTVTRMDHTCHQRQVRHPPPLGGNVD